jgi:hypothetical protein
MRSIDHKHPKGTKYTPNELRSRRDAWYALVASGHASQTTDKLRTQTRDAIEATERPFVVIDGFNVELTTLADAPDVRVPDALAGKDKGLYVTRFAVQPRWKNGGWEVSHYLELFAVLRQSGERIVIDGPCYSACTLVLSTIPHRVCVARRAILGFHAPRLVDDYGREYLAPDAASAVPYANVVSTIEHPWLRRVAKARDG